MNDKSCNQKFSDRITETGIRIQNTKKDLNAIFVKLEVFEYFGVVENPNFPINDWNEPWKNKNGKTGSDRHRKRNIEINKTVENEVSINVKTKSITITRFIIIFTLIFIAFVLSQIKIKNLPVNIKVSLTIVFMLCILFIFHWLSWEAKNSEKFRKIKRESDYSRYKCINYYENLLALATSEKICYPLRSLNRAKQIISLRIDRIEKIDNSNYMDIVAKFLSGLAVVGMIVIICLYFFDIPSSFKTTNWSDKATLAVVISLSTFLITAIKTMIEMGHNLLIFFGYDRSFYHKLKTCIVVIDDVVAEISIHTERQM